MAVMSLHPMYTKSFKSNAVLKKSIPGNVHNYGNDKRKI